MLCICTCSDTHAGNYHDDCLFHSHSSSNKSALVLESGKTFRHGYRNVIVVKKMTFPNDKLLTIEMTEKQISGRNISLNIDYEDILAADSFHADLLEEE